MGDEEFEGGGGICDGMSWWNIYNNTSSCSSKPLTSSLCSMVANNNITNGPNFISTSHDDLILDLMKLHHRHHHHHPSDESEGDDDDDQGMGMMAFDHSNMGFLDNINHQKSEKPKQSSEADSSLMINSTSQMMNMGFVNNLSSDPPDFFDCVVQQEEGICDNNSIHGQVKKNWKQKNQISIPSSNSIDHHYNYLYDDDGNPLHPHPQPQIQSMASSYKNLSNQVSPSNWSKVASSSPLKPSMPKQQHDGDGDDDDQISGFHFSNNNSNNNNGPFWNNVNMQVLLDDVPSSPTQVLLHQYPSHHHHTNFEPKPNSSIISPKQKREEGSDMAQAVKRASICEPLLKRPRIETPSPLPTFKVRKEKLGDRITALQQLVSPFGKTDTASVLHEAIDYIKFLHEQVTVLSAPYMNNVVSVKQRQGCSMNESEGKKDLRRQGLCLMPVSSSIAVANYEMNAELLWTPSYGGPSFIRQRRKKLMWKDAIGEEYKKKQVRVDKN